MALNASGAIDASAFTPPIARLLVPHVTADVPRLIDYHWHTANWLAAAIEDRNYGEIPRAMVAIDDTSPYQPWVPAAVELAIDQLDATAAGYARMNMCGELGRFLSRVDREWPAGRAAMRAVSCSGSICKSGRVAMIRELGIAGYHHLLAERHAELAGDLARAIAREDHQDALTTCSGMLHFGPLPASCLVQACAARELSVAEAILEHLDERAGERTANHPDMHALHACQRLGVAFFDGRARVTPVAGIAWNAHPVDLVRVHPDAPTEDRDD